MPRPLRTAVVVGGAAHMGAKSAQKSAAAQQQAAQQQAAQQQANQQQGAQAAPAASEATSQADEIRKYAAMKDQGLITEEEFAAKKRAILGI